MKKLTDRQTRVLNYLKRYQRRHGMPPTRAEIAQALGFSSANAAQQHLTTLARKGAILLTGGKSRGIRLKQESKPPATAAAPAMTVLELPLVGRVAAGAPLLAIENIETRHTVSASLFSRKPDYLLRVVGDSMRDAGILDGDLLAVAKTAEATPGQIIVARLDDEVTVKRLRIEGDRLSLVPENPDFTVIAVDPRAHEFAIEGVACGVIRDSSGKRAPH